MVLAPRQIQQPLDVGAGLTPISRADPAPMRLQGAPIHGVALSRASSFIHALFRQPFTTELLRPVASMSPKLGPGWHLIWGSQQEIILLVLLNLFTDAGLNFFLHAGQFRFAQSRAQTDSSRASSSNSSSTCWRFFDLAEHIGGNHIRQLTRVLNFQTGLHRLSGDAPLILQYSSK